MSAPVSIPVKVGNPEEYQYATWIADRTPQFKIHRTVGLAHSAITNRTRSRDYTLIMTADCALYLRAGVAWTVIYGFTRNQEMPCLPWQKDPGSPQRRRLEDHRRSIEMSIEGIRARIERLGLDPDTTNQLQQECFAFRGRLLELLQ